MPALHQHGGAAAPADGPRRCQRGRTTRLPGEGRSVTRPQACCCGQRHRPTRRMSALPRAPHAHSAAVTGVGSAWALGAAGGVAGCRRGGTGHGSTLTDGEQRGRGVVQRLPQARHPRRGQGLPRHHGRPPHGLSLAQPLQHHQEPRPLSDGAVARLGTVFGTDDPTGQLKRRGRQRNSSASCSPPARSRRAATTCGSSGAWSRRH